MNEETTCALRFDSKIEAKILMKLNKLFISENNCITEEEAIKHEQIAIVDPANICMIVGKTEQAKRILARFTDSAERNKVPELSFKAVSDDIISCKYSVEYLKKFMDLLSIFTDLQSVSWNMLKDYPLKVSSQHFDLILAPRVDND